MPVRFLRVMFRASAFTRAELRQLFCPKITIVAATVFMLSALFLSMPALTGNVSVLQTSRRGADGNRARRHKRCERQFRRRLPVNIAVDPNAANPNIIITNSAQQTLRGQYDAAANQQSF